MEISQLITFIEISRSGNLTRASEKLFTSQPAVSAQLKQLENELGFPLFTRTPKGMKLTEKGRLMLEEAQSVLDSVNRMHSKAKSLNQYAQTPVHIGLNTDNEVLRVNALVKQSAETTPDIHFRFLQTQSEEFAEDIKSGRIDAGFFYGDCTSRQVEYISIASYDLNIVYPKAWRAEIENSALEKLTEFPWIWTSKGCPFSRISLSCFEQKGFTLNKVMYVDDENLVGRLVQSEVGCSILASPIAEKLRRLDMLNIWGALDTQVSLNFGYAKENRNAPEITSLKSALTEIWNTPHS